MKYDRLLVLQRELPYSMIEEPYIEVLLRCRRLFFDCIRFLMVEKAPEFFPSILLFIDS